LSKRIDEHRHTGSGACIQKPNAGDFSWLLRVSRNPAQPECDSENDHPHQFSILDTST
jgi:hypothetical protein